jgi:hypothetical protein
MSEQIGFIILRHVNSELTNEYWQESYSCIRNFYPENKIVIIDDYSNNDFLKSDLILYNTEIINSEFHPGKGELLPIYYYLIYKWFKKAIIIHDSVFINNYINFDNVDKYKFLWYIEHEWNDIETEKKLINCLNNNKEILDLYNNTYLWQGCFGCMTIITHDYLKIIDEKYNLFHLFNVVNSRNERCALERVFGCILLLNDDKINYNSNDISLLNSITNSYYNGLPSIFGCWHYSFDDYKKNKCIFNTCMKYRLPIIKVWSGR